MDPRQRAIAEDFDKYRETYDEAVNKAIAFSGLTVDKFTNAKARDLVRLIKLHFESPEDVTVLDVGCGIGNYHPLLVPAVGSVTGIDVSQACIERARSRNPSVAYDIYDGERLPYPDNSFSVAYCVCVVHHVPPASWQRFVNELARVVAAGGMVIVYEHNPWHPLTRRVVGYCAFDRDAVLIAMPNMRELLRSAGCVNVSTRSILTLPPGLAISERLDVLFSRLPLGSQYRALGYIGRTT
jgi:ubiquinone/menaquinone biosynthesis C-methylase UbiE